MRLAVVIVLMLMALGSDATDALACGRCGVFGRACRFQSHVVEKVVAAPVVATPVVQHQQPLFVVQNNYPQPLAVQGQTVYGGSYQQIAASLTMDASAYLAGAQALQRDTLATLKAGQDAASDAFHSVLSLQATVAEPLARGEAAERVLRAAGLSAPTAGQTLALKITQTHDGQWQVENASAEQVNNAAKESAGHHPKPPVPEPNGGQQRSLVAEKCASCHGLELSAPKGGLYFDADHPLDPGPAIQALKAVQNGTMPKGATLSDDEFEQLTAELLALAKGG